MSTAPKNFLRNLKISFLGYGGDFLAAVKSAVYAVRKGVKALDPDYAKEVRFEMDNPEHPKTPQ